MLFENHNFIINLLQFNINFKLLYADGGNSSFFSYFIFTNYYFFKFSDYQDFQKEGLFTFFRHFTF